MAMVGLLEGRQIASGRAVDLQNHVGIVRIRQRWWDPAAGIIARRMTTPLRRLDLPHHRPAPCQRDGGGGRRRPRHEGIGEQEKEQEGESEHPVDCSTRRGWSTSKSEQKVPARATSYELGVWFGVWFGGVGEVVAVAVRVVVMVGTVARAGVNACARGRACLVMHVSSQGSV